MKSYFLKELKYELRQLWKKWGKLLAQGFAALAISLGTLFLWGTPVGQRLDLWILQNFFSYRGNRPPPPDVVIVGIDDITYQKLEVSPRLPFPRRFIADALEQLNAANPKVIIIDANIPKERVDEASEARIEAALRAGPTTIWSGEIPMARTGLVASDGSDSSIVQASDPKFRSAAKMELPMLNVVQYGMISRLSFDSSETADLYSRTPLARPLVELAKYDIIKPGPNELINFYGGQGTITRFSLYELIGTQSEEIKAKLKDKVVFFGYQSIGRGRGQMDKDEFEVPAPGRRMFGMEIHANIAANLIDRSWIRRPNIMQDVSALYVMALLIALTGIALSPEKAVPTILIILGSVVSASYYAFAQYQFWIAGVGALLVAGAITTLGGAFYHYVVIRSFKNYMRKTFKFETERDL